jgi:2-polyprenyl-3-methyl-5-hydroxy-6-metoxy-1,4-benzoquinol methylase
MMYENDVMLSKYLHFNYGERDSHLFNVPSNQILLSNYEPFAEKCATVGHEMFKKYSNSSVKPLSAFDLGCGMGRTAFELARQFDLVDAIDYSRAFIDEANRIKNDGTVTFNYFINGSNSKTVSLAIDADIKRERVNFT